MGTFKRPWELYLDSPGLVDGDMSYPFDVNEAILWLSEPWELYLDSPGLVDGDMSYPFDVNEAILWLSELCDLVFVFFDPIGQVSVFSLYWTFLYCYQ